MVIAIPLIGGHLSDVRIKKHDLTSVLPGFLTLGVAGFVCWTGLFGLVFLGLGGAVVLPSCRVNRALLAWTAESS